MSPVITASTRSCEETGFRRVPGEHPQTTALGQQALAEVAAEETRRP
jgi:hypothetical protein